ncbi:DUF302 domain-containing protein [Yoonia sp. MH D7]
MKNIVIAGLLAVASPALAEDVVKTSPLSVTETIDGLVAAVEGAGATVFARVDHAAGAASVDKSLPDAQLLIFGNPMLGTDAMELDIRAGLALPLRVLAYADADGTTQMMWTPAEDLFDGLDIAADADIVTKVNGALNGLTDKAIAAN